MQENTSKYPTYLKWKKINKAVFSATDCKIVARNSAKMVRIFYFTLSLPSRWNAREWLWFLSSARFDFRDGAAQMRTFKGSEPVTYTSQRGYLRPFFSRSVFRVDGGKKKVGTVCCAASRRFASFYFLEKVPRILKASSLSVPFFRLGRRL